MRDDRLWQVGFMDGKGPIEDVGYHRGASGGGTGHRAGPGADPGV